jgi:GNAT superfamily N-acetyltransferase
MAASPQAPPGYVLKHLSTKEEMRNIIDLIFAACHDPYDPVIQIFFPVLGFMPDDVTKAKKAHAERVFHDHVRANSSSGMNETQMKSVWLYVQHVDSGDVVACGQWEVHLSNPHTETDSASQGVKCEYWPEGSRGRDFAEQVVGQVYVWRKRWMLRPHLGTLFSVSIYIVGTFHHRTYYDILQYHSTILTLPSALNWMSVHPSHRRKGLASYVMQWGVDKADELGMECYLEASAMGQKLYERFAFGSLMRLSYDMNRADADDTWRRLEHELTPPPFTIMWRPPMGIWEKGLKMPWDR